MTKLLSYIKVLKVFAKTNIIYIEVLQPFLGEYEMEYLTTAETAERWGITVRRVQVLCKSGRIEGAVYKGVWLIPAGAEKPEDPRRIRKTDKE